MRYKLQYLVRAGQNIISYLLEFHSLLTPAAKLHHWLVQSRTPTRYSSGLCASFAKLRKTKVENKRSTNWQEATRGQLPLVTYYRYFNCRTSGNYSRTRTVCLAVRQRVSALRPVARSVDHRSAVVGSQLGMSGRYIWQRLSVSTFHSSSTRLFLLLCSICMPRERALCPARGRPSYSASRLRKLVILGCC